MSLEQALVDFGREIGIPTLSPAPHGGVQLRFDSGATLGAARQGEHVVVHLAEPVRAHEAAALLLRAMKRAANPEQGVPAVQPGLFNADGQDWLVLALRVAERGLDARELRRAADHLRQSLAQLSEAT